MTHLRKGSAEGILLLLAALAGLLLSFRLWGTPHAAAAVPLALVGLVQLASGASVLLRTPRRRRALALRLVQDPAAYRAEELARMEREMAGFRVYRTMAAAVLALGLLPLLLLRHDPGWLAVGLSAVAEGALLLVLVLSAQARGRAYVAALRRFLDPAAPVAGETDLGE